MAPWRRPHIDACLARFSAQPIPGRALSPGRAHCARIIGNWGHEIRDLCRSGDAAGQTETTAVLCVGTLADLHRAHSATVDRPALGRLSRTDLTYFRPTRACPRRPES